MDTRHPRRLLTSGQAQIPHPLIMTKPRLIVGVMHRTPRKTLSTKYVYGILYVYSILYRTTRIGTENKPSSAWAPTSLRVAPPLGLYKGCLGHSQRHREAHQELRVVLALGHPLRVTKF